MTTADLVNRIIEKLGGNRVEFIRIESNETPVVEFRHAGNDYYIHGLFISESEICVMRNKAPGFLVGDSYSFWVEGVLRGKTRDEAGVLS